MARTDRPGTGMVPTARYDMSPFKPGATVRVVSAAGAAARHNGKTGKLTVPTGNGWWGCVIDGVEVKLQWKWVCLENTSPSPDYLVDWPDDLDDDVLGYDLPTFDEGSASAPASAPAPARASPRAPPSSPRAPPPLPPRASLPAPAPAPAAAPAPAGIAKVVASPAPTPADQAASVTPHFPAVDRERSVWGAPDPDAPAFKLAKFGGPSAFLDFSSPPPTSSSPITVPTPSSSSSSTFTAFDNRSDRFLDGMLALADKQLAGGAHGI